jgi:hypothetical protein
MIRKSAEDTMSLVEAEGNLRRQGITTYQYGTHVLLDRSGNTLYALRSSQVNLDTYDGQYVRVSGSLVPDYPVDLGPKYMLVSAVQVPASP